MYPRIESTQNGTVKQLLKLQEKSRERRKKNRFLIEGLRELELARQGGYHIDKIFVHIGHIEKAEVKALLTEEAQTGTEIVELSEEVFNKLAYRENTQGVLALAQSKLHELSELILSNNALVLVAEAPEKPGNIGALLRTADAAGIDAVIIANPLTDLYNPNIIRSSVGCVFTTAIATASSSEVIAYLKEKKIQIFSAILQEAVSYDTQNYAKATAIVVGTEADGLTEEWRKASTQCIKIPMNGVIDSMNVSVAAGILIFEAKRQRKL